MGQLDQTIAKESAPQPFWLDLFGGVNVHDDRRAIEEGECAWLENFAPLGKGNARTMYDHAEPIHTSAGTIVYDFPFNIGATFYHAIFLSDGSAKAIAVSNGAATVMGAAATFAVSPTLPACAQWGASGIVIITANGYYAWDGTLYSPGDASPLWLNGLTAAFQTTGDTHTTTTIDGLASTSGVVDGMMVTSSTADLPVQDLVVSHTGTACVLSDAATGSNSAQTFTFTWMMPLGLAGSAIEIFQSRVWIMNGAQFSFSAPSNGADFNTADGGGTTKSTDGFLKTKFMNVRQSNGFLYLFGDGSINVISNVQTTGSPATTTFNNQNVDPQTGLGWRDALCSFGRALCFANPTGVYALFGGAADKISEKIDHLFENANFTTVTPTMFVCSIFGVRCLGIILNTNDPSTDTQRTIMALWNGKLWFIGSQSLEPIFSTTMEVDANPQGWGNDGTHVYELFATRSETLQKKVQSKLWAGRSNLIKKTSKDVYAETADIAGAGVVVTGTLDSGSNASVAFAITSNIFFINNTSGTITFVNGSSQALQFISSPEGVQGTRGNTQSGLRLGLTLTSTSPDFILVGTGLTYKEEAFYGR